MQSSICSKNSAFIKNRLWKVRFIKIENFTLMNVFIYLFLQKWTQIVCMNDSFQRMEMISLLILQFCYLLKALLYQNSYLDMAIFNAFQDFELRILCVHKFSTLNV